MQTTSEPRQPELLDAKEMQRILGVGRSTFYSLARRDALPVPVIRVGKRMVFSRRAVEDLLNRRHGEPQDGQHGDAKTDVA